VCRERDAAAEVVGMSDGAPTTAAAGEGVDGEGEAREVPRVELGARRRSGEGDARGVR
jgi:hypothetical protein